MKNLILIIAICISYSVHAQDFLKKNFDAQSINNIEIDAEWCDVKVTFEDISEVRLSFDITINGQSAKKAIEIEDKVRSGKLRISTSLDYDQIDEMVTLIYRDGHRLTMTKEAFNEGKDSFDKWEHMNTGYDTDGQITIVLPKNKIIDIKTTYGDIDAVYSNSVSKHDLTLHSIYGHVDLAIPASLSADLEMASGYGEIYTDLNFDISKNYNKRSDCNFGDHIKGKLNKGTNGAIDLEATYDNIYLRKI